MKEPKVLVTMKDVQRYKIIKDVLQKRLKATEASQILNLSYIHLLWLKKKVKEHGFKGILRHGRDAPNKIPNKLVDTVVELRKKYYYDFNIMHLKDKLDEVHKIHLSYESIRKILICAKEHYPKKKKKIHRLRRRMPKAGMLVQMDSSQHFWLPLVENKWWLIAAIDDATNEVPYAKFFAADTLYANMHVLRRFIEIKGVFMSLYVDKASHFKTTRYGGLHVQVSENQEDTQIERALTELDINLIAANSPQAKGRIEVTFRLFQDRLIKEMRLAKVKSYVQANKFLIDNFLPWYNAKYTHQAENSYLPASGDKNLDTIFCIKRKRTVKADNTIQIDGQTIQIPPSNIRTSFAHIKVAVCLLEDKRIFVLYQGSVIAESTLNKKNKVIQKENKIETLLNKREYVPMLAKPRTYSQPDKDHPWYAFRLKNSTPNRKLKANILK